MKPFSILAMADGSGETLTKAIFAAIKILIALFILKVVLIVLGYKGYIPFADEVFAAFMKVIMLFGTGKAVIPTSF